jgi:hypothetical protein
MRSLVILVLLAIPMVAAQGCQPFQLYESPVVMYGAQKCSAFANSACCGFGIATRAYNWAKEDDGCGVVSGDCLQLLTDIACHTNCAPNMQTRVVENVRRPAVCMSWVRRIYDACLPYQWCTTTQEQASTCAFMKTKTSTRRDGRYSSTTTTTSMQNAWDTCTMVDDITMTEFARKILEVEPVDGNCSTPLAQPRVLTNPNSVEPRVRNAFLIAVTLAAFVIYTTTL